MDEHLIDEIIKVLIIFAMEAFEHEGESDEEQVVYTHHVTVGNLRRARNIIKELEKLKKNKTPHERYNVKLTKVFTHE